MTREEAIEVYNGLINTKIKEAFEFFAPELAESEDERIRTRLSEYFRGFLEGNEHCYKDGGYVKWEGLDVKSILDWLEKQKEQKPAWSEEYEEMLRTIISDGSRGVELDSKQISWLKSLRPQPPVEWTEEDRRMLRACIEAVGSMSIRGDVQDLRDWLKSLCPDCCNRPKPAGGWRPSEEQIDVMKEAVMYFGDSWISSKHKILLGLYEQLKKLI